MSCVNLLAQRHQVLPGGDQRARRAVQLLDRPRRLGAATAISIFMASRTISFCPASTRSPGSTAMFQTLAVTGEQTGAAAFGHGVVRGGARAVSSALRRTGRRRPRPSARARPRRPPAGVRLNARGLGLDGAQEGVIVRAAGNPAARCAADSRRAESRRGSRAVPRRRPDRSGSDRRSAAATACPARTRAWRGSVFHICTRAADELIAAGAFHAVDAQVRAADADGVFGRPGARGVVLGGDQAMARIERAWPPARPDRRRPGRAPDSWRRRRCGARRRWSRGR